MRLVTLIENEKLDLPGIKSEHGLCLYIETESNKILLDVGRTKRFLHNARKLNIDISEIDSVFISHGHFDHGGGLEYFLRNNSKAKIYIKRNFREMI